MSSKMLRTTELRHVFVLCIENQSFDRIYGASNISGIDAVTGEETKVDGILDKEYSNTYDGITYTPTLDATFTVNCDPCHEFHDTFKGICGEDAVYDRKIQYKDITKDMSGFVYQYNNTSSKDEGHPKSDFGAVIKVFDTQKDLPIMYALAKEFVVCDKFQSSFPGPTWPNRLFLHGGSSSGLDDSPSTLDTIKYSVFEGIKFDNGSIFDLLTKRKINWKIYGGKKTPIAGSIPLSSAIKGITLDKWSSFDSFAEDLKVDNYEPEYIFIEPNYGDIISGTYKMGSSGHPMDDIRGCELFIKEVYETIRNSSVWESSALIILTDENGGFADHVEPPSAIAPGDSMEYNINGFDFTQLGVRVPALIISPLIPKNTIDHTQYEHCSVLSTIERLWNLPPLTKRDANANDFLHLFSLPTPRDDCPLTLPNINYVPACEVKSNFPLIKEIPERGNIHVMNFIIQKHMHELGLEFNQWNTIENIQDNLRALIPEIEKHRARKKNRGCCVVS
jgi:phospholipase C